MVRGFSFSLLRLHNLTLPLSLAKGEATHGAVVSAVLSGFSFNYSDPRRAEDSTRTDRMARRLTA